MYEYIETRFHNNQDRPTSKVEWIEKKMLWLKFMHLAAAAAARLEFGVRPPLPRGATINMQGDPWNWQSCSKTWQSTGKSS